MRLDIGARRKEFLRLVNGSRTACPGAVSGKGWLVWTNHSLPQTSQASSYSAQGMLATSYRSSEVTVSQRATCGQTRAHPPKGPVIPQASGANHTGLWHPPAQRQDLKTPSWCVPGCFQLQPQRTVVKILPSFIISLYRYASEVPFIFREFDKSFCRCLKPMIVLDLIHVLFL